MILSVNRRNQSTTSVKLRIMKRIVSPGAWLGIALLLVVAFNLWGSTQLHFTSTDENGRNLEESLGQLSALVSSCSGNEAIPERQKQVNTTAIIATMNSEPVDLVAMAHKMLESFVRITGNKTASISRHDFPRLTVSSKNPNQNPNLKQCDCDLFTLDCLDSIACIPVDMAHRNALVILGIETRKAIAKTATFEGQVHDVSFVPIGKGQQYATIEAFEGWRWDNTLPRKHFASQHNFVNETYYEECRHKKLHGKSCFFRKINLPEDTEREVLERNARAWLEQSGELEAVGSRVQRLLQSFIHHQRRQFHDVHIKRESLRKQKATQEGVSVPTSTMSPLGQLILFSHLSRMLFHRRPFLQDIFEGKLTEMKPPVNATLEGINAASKDLPPFTVSIHIRRGDSCAQDEYGKEMPHMTEPSDLYSPAQMTNVRKCYETQVYIKPLERIRRILPSNQPLHVYLSTDNTESIINEIATKHSRIYANVVDQWIILDYSRDDFRYDFVGDSIEGDQNEKRAIMGESAVNDLWLLSHGMAFIGHLGSRFGKVAWMLATARHNSFIPYYSVDGHSFCCDVDESCGSVQKYVMDMENCLTFSHEYAGHDVGDQYWEVGSLARKKEYYEVLRLMEPKNVTPA